MLIIRKEQMQVLEQAAFGGFEDRMVVHLQRFFPEQYAALDDDGMRETVRYGIEWAKSYSIVDERDVCRYIDLMIVFGRHFDTSPETLWAGRILNQESLTDPTSKVERLYDEGMKSLVSHG
jgi:hypothetical protein